MKVYQLSDEQVNLISSDLAELISKLEDENGLKSLMVNLQKLANTYDLSAKNLQQQIMKDSQYAKLIDNFDLKIKTAISSVDMKPLVDKIDRATENIDISKLVTLEKKLEKSASLITGEWKNIDHIIKSQITAVNDFRARARHFDFVYSLGIFLTGLFVGAAALFGAAWYFKDGINIVLPH